jgi:hypothetical protein
VCFNRSSSTTTATTTRVSESLNVVSFNPWLSELSWKEQCDALAELIISKEEADVVRAQEATIYVLAQLLTADVFVNGFGPPTMAKRRRGLVTDATLLRVRKTMNLPVSQFQQ